MQPHISNIRFSMTSLIFSRAVPYQIAAVGLGFVVGPLAVVPLAMQARLIDHALPAKDVRLAVLFATLFGLALIARSLIKAVVNWLQIVIAEIVARDLRQALLDTQRRRTPDAARRALGTATSVVTSEVDALGGFIAEAISTPVQQIAVMTGVLGFMLVAEPVLAAIGLTALALEAITTPLLQRRVNLQTSLRIQNLRAVSGETIEAAETGERHHIVEALKGVRATYHIDLVMNALKIAMKLVKNVIDHLADAAVLGVGAWMVIEGHTQVGVIVAFLAGLREVREPWGEMIGYYRRWQEARTKLGLIRAAIEP